MRTALFTVCLFVAFSGCGPERPLDPAFAGHWVGVTTLTVDGASPASANGALDIAVHGETATLAGVCLDGGGLMEMGGAFTSLRWQGSYACPPMAFSDCSSVSISYQTGAADLETDSNLSAHVFGVGTGCGETHNLSVQFLGSK